MHSFNSMTPCGLHSLWLKPLCLQPILMGDSPDKPDGAGDPFPPVPPDDSGTGNQRGRKRRRQSVRPVCGCNCRDVTWRDLGPTGRWSQRCRCPMCGHRSIEGGSGCHRRLLVWQPGCESVLCPVCATHCIEVLRKEDVHRALLGEF